MKKLITVLLIICTLIIFTACNAIDGLKKDLGLSVGDETENSADDQNNSNPGNENQDSNDEVNPDDGNQDNNDDVNPDDGNQDNNDDVNPDDNNQGNTGSNPDDDNQGNTGNETSKTKADQWRETYECITIDEAYDICDAAGSTKTEERYYLIGTVVSIYTDKDKNGVLYGKMDIEDSTGELFVYGTYGADGELRYGALNSVPNVGDVVLFYGNFMNYNGTREMYSGWMIDFYTPTNNDSGNTGSGNNGGTTTGTKEDTWRANYDCITVQEAFSICDQTGETESSRYYIIATIVSLDSEKAYYGKMTVKDSTGEILVYGARDSSGNVMYGDMSSKPSVGDVVLFYASFKNYGGTREIFNGHIIDFYTPENGNSGNTGSGNTGSGSTSTSHTYNDFTSDEKALMNELIGLVIPFIPNDEYYLEEYIGENEFEGEYGIYMYTYDNTTAEFSAYRQLLIDSDYTLEQTDVDEDGYTWYLYLKGDVSVEFVHYYYDSYYVIELYAYITDNDSNSGSTGSGTGSGSGNTSTDLPEGTDGVYNVDFTDATNVKDVTDQGLYIDGCPTTGSPAVLVIPVQFTDKLAASSYDLDKLEDAFTKIDPNDGFYSVYEYYYISSYGQLTLDITVIDSWFTPSRNSTYYKNSIDSEGYGNGDMLVMDEAIAYLATFMDLSKFDSDNNGFIDAIILVNTLSIDSNSDFNWAYRYWNYHGDNDGNYYKYDGVSANDYVWASFNFLFESYDEDDNPIYTDTSVMNTYTFIHEFAHVLGVDDYYNYNGDDHPMDGCDVMDAMFGDHNPFSKFNLGWITTSRLVVTDSTVTLTLEDFSKNGDSIIIANNWNEDLGAYQEYYVLMYYKNTGLNDYDAGYGYFLRDGVVVYHVNAVLTTERYYGETYYNIANSNSSPGSDGSGSEDNLIEFVKSAEDTFTYIEGDTIPNVKDDDGNYLGYTFVIDELTDEYATITFTAK